MIESYAPPTLSLWSFRPTALQIWHTIGSAGTVFQALIVLFLILYAATIIYRLIRNFTEKPAATSTGDE